MTVDEIAMSSRSCGCVARAKRTSIGCTAYKDKIDTDDIGCTACKATVCRLGRSAAELTHAQRNYSRTAEEVRIQVQGVPWSTGYSGVPLKRCVSKCSHSSLETAQPPKNIRCDRAVPDRVALVNAKRLELRTSCTTAPRRVPQPVSVLLDPSA
jgi:hypothetical protein